MSLSSSAVRVVALLWESAMVSLIPFNPRVNIDERAEWPHDTTHHQPTTLASLTELQHPPPHPEQAQINACDIALGDATQYCGELFRFQHLESRALPAPTPSPIHFTKHCGRTVGISNGTPHCKGEMTW
ncbi:hypothetical protein F5880DRAFT_643794 [Lentinula raphanica]|nr:hypothetical protein F5880DRAFT_643794 [Lentinula raphanica]